MAHGFRNAKNALRQHADAGIPLQIEPAIPGRVPTPPAVPPPAVVESMSMGSSAAASPLCREPSLVVSLTNANAEKCLRHAQRYVGGAMQALECLQEQIRQNEVAFVGSVLGRRDCPCFALKHKGWSTRADGACWPHSTTNVNKQLLHPTRPPWGRAA